MLETGTIVYNMAESQTINMQEIETYNFRINMKWNLKKLCTKGKQMVDIIDI